MKYVCVRSRKLFNDPITHFTTSKILKDAGFLTVDRRGKWAYYAIKPLDPFHESCLVKIKALNVVTISCCSTCGEKA